MTDTRGSLPSGELLLLRDTLRLLLGEDPVVAEELALGVNLPELERIVEVGHGIVSIIGHDGTNLGYVSVRDHRRETTAELPAWARAEDLVEIRVPEPGRAVRAAAERLATSMRADQPQLFSALGLDKALETVGAYDWDPDPESVSTLAALAVEIRTGLAERVATDAANLPTWGPEAFDRLFSEYKQFHLSGRALIPLLSDLMLLLVAGAWGVEAIGHVQEAHRTEGDQPPHISLASLDVYAEALDIVTEGYLWRLELAGARVLRAGGDKARDRAVTSVTFEDFHFHLYAALAYYLTAKNLYQRVLRQAVGPATRTEAEKGAHFCEEMRVRILTSIAWAADFNTHRNNFTRPGVVEWWVLSLMDEDRPEERVLDLFSQLTYPAVIRDLALARLRTFDPASRRAGIGQLEAVVERLARERDRITALDQAVFLRYAQAILDQARRWLEEPSAAVSYLDNNRVR